MCAVKTSDAHTPSNRKQVLSDGQCAKERIINKQAERRDTVRQEKRMGEKEEKRVGHENWIWMKSRLDMRNTLGH